MRSSTKSWISIALFVLICVGIALAAYDRNYGIQHGPDPSSIFDKSYRPPYTTNDYVPGGQDCSGSGKSRSCVTRPGYFVTNYHPASYQVLVTVNDKQLWMNVTPGFYDSIQIGDQVAVRWSTGVLSHATYVRSVERK